MPTIRSDQINLQLQPSTWGMNATDQGEGELTVMSNTQSTSQDVIEDRALRQPQPPITPTTPIRTTIQGSSTSAISGSSYLPPSLSPSLVAASAIDGEDKHKAPRLETTPRSVRRRPRISDFQRCESAPELPHRTTHKDRHISRRKHIKRRARSADPSARNATRFTSPDRYTATRSRLNSSSSPLRTARHPSLLKTDERLQRQRSSNANVFRTTDDRRRGRAITRSAPNRSRPFQPPHFTPSFVQMFQRGVERDQSDGGAGSVVRRPSTGSIWRLGGWSPVPGQLRGVDLGNGAVTASGTNAPMIDSNFFQQDPSDVFTKSHELRLALALDIDVAQRVLPITDHSKQLENSNISNKVQYQWFNSSWTYDYNFSCTAKPKTSILQPEKVVPTIAFRVLDAPRLKDDYYCSILAYCRTLRTLAVALTHRVYLWTEKYGVRYPPLTPVRQTNYVTSLAFSSDEGGKAILATSRNSGSVTLWSLLEQIPRFELPHSSAACSTAFKPRVTRRLSSTSCSMVRCEDLLVGDDVGHIYYYSIEWPEYLSGSVTLLVKIQAHAQNVCGLAWAPDANSFVSGSNDNCALFFDPEDVLSQNHYRSSKASAGSQDTSRSSPGPADSRSGSDTVIAELMRGLFPTSGRDNTRETSGIGQNQYNAGRTNANVGSRRRRSSDRDELHFPETPPISPASPNFETPVSANNDVGPNHVDTTRTYRWSFYHSAAVKAIAFAPWQPSLLATGGGSNDRQIHFHHTGTGTTLAVINVYAQVTSLAWSSTRREIVATFGYAQPEHEVRIAVFAWPSCDCVVSIPWERKANGEVGRALWAIPYPGGPNDAAPERMREPNEAHDFWQEQRGRTRGLSTETYRLPPSPPASPERHVRFANYTRIRNFTRTRQFTRREGETWASRTEEEGSLIVACCDQTVKFFEVWAGKSKGKSRGLGSKAGVLGGSKVLEGWCEDMAIEEVGTGEDVIR